ncbi:MAG: hypothetical protein C4523_08800 [Myxococcales bacterium]|nr:MAG: hypothetical protein C4523_08800 [Myxococcales bacterium]
MSDPDGPARSSGHRLTDEQRAIAREIWALRAGRSARRTAAILTMEHGIAVSHQSIDEYARRHDWATWATDLLSRIAPDLIRTGNIDYLIGGSQAAAVMRAIMDDEAVDPRTRLQAAIALADRAGWSPLGRAPAPRIDAPALAGDHVDIDALSPADLAQLERQLIERHIADRSTDRSLAASRRG